MELFNTLKDAFAPAKFIEQAEKNTQSMLAYVEPKELGKTLITLTSDVSTFARAQVEAFESITATFQKQAEEFTNKFAKAVK
jgi:catalase (peroxidase I)